MQRGVHCILAALICLALTARLASAQGDDPTAGVPNAFTGPNYGGPVIPNSTPIQGPVRPAPAVRPSTWPGANPNPNPPGVPAGPQGYPTQYPGGQYPAQPNGQYPPQPNGQYPPQPNGQNPAQPGNPGPPPYAGPPASAAPPTTAPQPAVPAPTPRKPPTEPPYDPAQVVGHVGSEVILASELLSQIHRAVEQVSTQNAAQLAQLAPEEREVQLNEFRREMMKRGIEDAIKFKLLYSEVRRKAPPEGFSKHEAEIRKHFNTKGIEGLRQDYKAGSVVDLEDKLVAVGTSLEAQRRQFIERQMALGWLNQQVKEEKEPTHEQMVAYYREHVSKWETPARARWEQLTVKFDNAPNKGAAYAEIARWGNDIFRGVPFGTVAKAHSQDLAAEEGGVHDWASKGSLRSTALDAALFSLPVGTLSPILEDEDGFHIIRVVARDEAKRSPFNEVQQEVKKMLHDGDKDKKRMEYIADLRKHTPVWTIFDENADAMAGRPTPPPR